MIDRAGDHAQPSSAPCVPPASRACSSRQRPPKSWVRNTLGSPRWFGDDLGLAAPEWLGQQPLPRLVNAAAAEPVTAFSDLTQGDALRSPAHRAPPAEATSECGARVTGLVPEPRRTRPWRSRTCPAPQASMGALSPATPRTASPPLWANTSAFTPPPLPVTPTARRVRTRIFVSTSPMG
jgi:hypothetical protein